MGLTSIIIFMVGTNVAIGLWLGWGFLKRQPRSRVLVGVHLIFGLSFLVALFFFYRFTWFLIPESERARYNLLTSPLWPRHLGWILPRRDRRENDA